MAYAALGSAAQAMESILVLVEKCSNHHQKQMLKSLHENICSLKVFLDDFPEEAQISEAQIRIVANEVEDVIEEFLTKQVKSNDEINKIPCVINSQFHDPDQLKHLRPYLKRLFQNLQKVTKKIKSVEKEAARVKKSLQISETQNKDDSSNSSKSRLGSSCKSDTMIGFDEDLEAIKERLASTGKSPLKFIPIVGMGGIGKTTLARNAYNNQLSFDIFHIRAWVTVSQNYSAEDVLGNLSISLAALHTKKEGDTYAEHVYRSLKGMRYLVVLDDIWSTEVWDDVKRIFPDDCNGSRIIFTTRLSYIASYVDSSFNPVHEMHFLDPNQSWDLLRDRVSGPIIEYRPELERVGRQIAKSCGGLPLGIVVVAGILSTADSTLSSWEKIAHMVNRNFSVEDENLENIFSLSYSHLPRHLRSCFLYMAAFPEDYEIPAGRLIKLWLAEGFLETKGGSSENLEERGKEYLEDLVKRSLILVRKRSSIGKIKTCVIHDLMRDMVIKKAGEEDFLMSPTDMDILILNRKINQRRIGLSHLWFCRMDDIIASCSSTLRTLLYFHVTHLYSKSSSLTRFQLLRVFDALEVYFGKCPDELFELILLRYLALNFHWDGECIFEKIIKLQKLQTLILHHNRVSFEELEVQIIIWKMPQLRHIVCPAGISLPPVIESCALNLHSISGLENFYWSKRTCEMFPNLKKLGIREFRWSDIHSLIHLPKLEELKLHSLFKPSIKRRIAFPTTLKKLTLNRVTTLPYLGIDGSLPNLEVLKLKNYYVSRQSESKTWETQEGQFPHLKSLMIVGTDLELWITESSHFPNLRHLRLHGCRGLREIPVEIGEIQTLKLIEIDDWNKSLLDSVKRVQQEVQDYGNQLEVAISRGLLSYDYDSLRT